MKKILLSLMLTFSISVAQAALTIVNPLNITFGGYDGQPASITGTYTSGQWGALSASKAGTFSATYLGNESGHENLFGLLLGGVLFESNAIGTTITADVNAGIIPFGFFDFTTFSLFENGESQESVLGFAILQGQKNNYGEFDYILGFNDQFKSDADYDDFVVGVKFVAAAVPEPETYAMMIIGLSLVGFASRRNTKKE